MRYIVNVYILIFVFIANLGMLSAVEKSPSEKVYRLGYRENFAPFEFTNKQGKASGYVVEFYKIIAEQLKFKLEFVPGNVQSLNELFNQNKIDVITSFNLDALSEKTEKENINNFFSSRHSYCDYIIIYNKDNHKIKTLDDLKKTKNLAINDDLLDLLLKQHNIKVKSACKMAKIVSQISTGEYDCAIVPDLQYYYCLTNENKYYDNIEIVSKPIATVPLCSKTHINDSVFFNAIDKIEIDSNLDVRLLDNIRKWINAPRKAYVDLVAHEKAKGNYKSFFKSVLGIIVVLALVIITILFIRLRKTIKDLRKKLDNIERKKEIQQIVYQISEDINNCDDINEIYNNIHFQINRLIPANNFFIAFYSEEKDLLEFVYFIDEYDTTPEPINPGNTLTGLVIDTKKPLLCDPEEFNKLVAEGKVDSVGAPSIDWLGVPLLESDKVIGAIVIQSYTEGIRYDSDDKELLLFVANQISLAIARKHSEQEIYKLNAELEQRVEERTHQLEDALVELKFENEERKRTQDALEKAQKELENAIVQEKELGEMKTRFVSIVSHEYRTPLTVILSSTYLMERYFDIREKQEFIKSLTNIQLSVKSMTNLLDDVLIIGKTEAGKITVINTEIKIYKLILSIIDDIKLTDKNNHTIEVLCENENIELNTDLNLFSKIMINLLSNAIKYSPAESLVTVNIVDSDQFIQVSVQDRGIGIPKDKRSHLFETYHRFNNVGAVAGTGLGLSIVKKFIDVMGGQISFVSEENVGSTFTVTLKK